MSGTVNRLSPASLPAPPVVRISPTGPIAVPIQGDESGDLSQVYPPESVSDLAASALRSLRGPQTWSNSSARLHAMLQGDRRNDALLARALVGRVAKSMLALKDNKLEELLRQFPDADDTDQLLQGMKKAGLAPAAQALLLAAMAQQHRVGRRRRQLEEALDELLAGGTDWELALLGWVEFGAINQEAMSELKSLYQRTSMVRQGLARFLQQLAGVGQRRRKIKVLIRALGAELAGGSETAPDGARLVSVVRDLKRLLIFLGCEEQCAHIAAGLGTPGVDGEVILKLLIRMIDEAWLFPDWIGEEAKAISLDPCMGFKLGRGFTWLTKRLPEPCFRDEEQRKQILETLAAFAEREDA